VDDAHVHRQVVPVGEEQQVGELVGVLHHQAVVDHGGGPALAGVGAEAVDVGKDGLDVGADADGLVSGLGDAVQREHEAEPEAPEHRLDPGVPLGGVGDHGDRQLGGELGHEVPRPVVLGAEERLTAGELGGVEVGEERGQVLEEVVAVGGREGGPVLTVDADRRRQVTVALQALEVAGVREVELHEGWPGRGGGIVRQVLRPGQERRRVGRLGSFLGDLHAAALAPERPVVDGQAGHELVTPRPRPDVGQSIGRHVAEREADVATARPHVAVRVEVQLHRRCVAGGMGPHRERRHGGGESTGALFGGPSPGSGRLRWSVRLGGTRRIAVPSGSRTFRSPLRSSNSSAPSGVHARSHGTPRLPSG